MAKKGAQKSEVELESLEIVRNDAEGEGEENPEIQLKSDSKPVERTFLGDTSVHHDLFRLELATTIKNVSWNSEPLYEKMEHKHIYHSVTSDGTPQDTCCPASGHFHYVTVKEVDGKLVAECSRPYVMGKKKVIKNGRVKFVKQAVPYEADEHTHKVTYLRSEKITRRVYNADAVKVISQIQSEEAKRMTNPLG